MSGPTKLGVLKSTHARLDLAYVRRLRALYKGGKALLGDDDVMSYVFPRTPQESIDSYEDRKRRAFYDNDFAMVINRISAGLAQDPLTFDDGADQFDPTKKPKGAKDEEKSEPPKAAQKTGPKIDAYWTEIQKDATPPDDDGPRKTLDEVIREAIVEGLVCGWGWILCDLPPPLDVEPGSVLSLGDQERAGKLRAYPVPVPCDQVLNWHEKRNVIGWLRMYTSELLNEAPEEAPEYTRHIWKVWTAEDVTTYQLELNKDGKDRTGREWKDDDVVPTLGAPTPHSFKRVPWVRFDCSAPNEPAMHVGDIIESRCRSQFNQQSGEAYLRSRSMFQQLYEFLGPEGGTPDQEVSEAQENPHRASRRMTSRAPDIVQIRGAGDEARFVGPDMGSAAINLQAISEGREAIPRITGVLAMASDNAGALVKRSGESKAMDKVEQQVLLGAVGKKGLAFAGGVTDMLAIGRGDDPKKRPAMRGFEHFEVDDAQARIDQHVALATAPFKSAAAMIDLQLLAIKAAVGDAVSPERLALYREQLESAITQDAIENPPELAALAGDSDDQESKPTPKSDVKPPAADQAAAKKGRR